MVHLYAAFNFVLLLGQAKGKTTPPLIKHEEIADFGACHLKAGVIYTPYVVFTVDTAGRPQEVRLSQTSGNACVDQSAVGVVPTFIFEAARRSGKPVSFRMELGIPMENVGKTSLHRP